MAQYEDVTGLCKLACIADIEEQDYSLNSGRYVGVVIEEDGLTDEAFEESIVTMSKELSVLNRTSIDLQYKIESNLKLLW